MKGGGDIFILANNWFELKKEEMIKIFLFDWN